MVGFVEAEFYRLLLRIEHKDRMVGSQSLFPNNYMAKHTDSKDPRDSYI